MYISISLFSSGCAQINRHEDTDFAQFYMQICTTTSTGCPEHMPVCSLVGMWRVSTTEPFLPTCWELRKSSLLFCSDLTGANQNVGHCLSMWDMRQGMEMLCSPTKKVEQMISEYFQDKMNSLSHPKWQLLSRKISYGLLTEESRCCFANGGKYLCGWWSAV